MTLKPFSQFVNRLRELAEGSPETVAECRYFDVGSTEPVCIVGHGLAELGVLPDRCAPASRLVGPAGELVGATGDTAPRLNWNAAGLRKPTKKQLAWVAELQSEQDSQESWGKALELADAFVKNEARDWGYQ